MHGRFDFVLVCGVRCAAACVLFICFSKKIVVPCSIQIKDIFVKESLLSGIIEQIRLQCLIYIVPTGLLSNKVVLSSTNI